MPAEPSQARQAGVVGSPIAHSLSPVLHRAAYQALGLSHWSYGRHEVRSGRLGTFVRSLDPHWVGLSVTMPGKEEALALSVHASATATATGAANTLVRHGDAWHAHNTDVDGIVRALAAAGCHGAQSAWLIGSGATARSALVACARLGVHRVVLQVRSQARVEAMDLADSLGLTVQVRRYAEGPPPLHDVSLAVSTVPAGGVLPLQRLEQVRSLVALDVVYHPRHTPWSTTLRAAGASIVDGSQMLLHQACAQVELMTGEPAPIAQMGKALAEAIDGPGR